MKHILIILLLVSCRKEHLPQVDEYRETRTGYTMHKGDTIWFGFGFTMARAIKFPPRDTTITFPSFRLRYDTTRFPNKYIKL